MKYRILQFPLPVTNLEAINAKFDALTDEGFVMQTYTLTQDSAQFFAIFAKHDHDHGHGQGGLAARIAARMQEAAQATESDAPGTMFLHREGPGADNPIRN